MTLKFNMSLVGSAALIALVTCTAGVDSQEPRTPRNLDEFDALFHEYNNWGRWGVDDERGTMNLITEEKTREGGRPRAPRYHGVVVAQSDARRGGGQS